MSTEKPRPLQGYRESQETKRDTPVDPKRFQEEMKKVTESDASQQFKKRNLTKSEEEPEDEEVQKEIPSPGSNFSTLMSDSDDNGILAPQTPQNTRAATTTTSSSQFIIEDDGNAPLSSSSKASAASSIYTPNANSAASPLDEGYLSDDAEHLPRTVSEEQFSTAQGNLLTLSDNTPQLAKQDNENNSIESSQTPSAPRPKRVAKGQFKDTSLQSDKQESTYHTAKKKKEKSPEIKLEAGSKNKEKQKTSSTKKISESLVTPKSKEEKIPITAKDLEDTKQNSKESFAAKAPLFEEEKAVKQTAPLKKEEKISVDKNALPEKNSAFFIEGKGSDTEKDSRDDKDKESSMEGLFGPGEAPTPIIPTPQADTPAYTKLDSQVFELFERMVGSMMVNMSDKEHTVTTVTIDMKGSVFDGSKIVLDHWKFAPNSYNVQIFTTPDGQKMLDDKKNRALLQQSFDELNQKDPSTKQAPLAIIVNLQKSQLLDDYHQEFKRKESASGEKDDSNKEQRQKKK